ncbi:hypothetical protein NPIL_58361 [Nephila pilipes]|uniref:Uncharacterized protein n=1 Tax=Nephila pilipes TaxID=299642 RepID=A0A8X6TKN3_NEPPI|nr:hypothetical protein NPIL_58361 [Nephila pilipes]
MIDWVSIVRTSRRRFSSYKYIPGRIRKRKKKQAAAAEAAKVEPPPKPPTQGCACCALTRGGKTILKDSSKDFPSFNRRLLKLKIELVSIFLPLSWAPLPICLTVMPDDRGFFKLRLPPKKAFSTFSLSAGRFR